MLVPAVRWQAQPRRDREGLRVQRFEDDVMQVGDHAARLAGVNVTGIFCGPEMKFDGSHLGASASAKFFIRVSTSTSIASISMRAMCWPRQPCGPVPNAMCSLGLRARSSL